MSFSTATKNELARVIGQRSCCRLAELSALIKMGGSVQISSGQRLSLHITTENAAVARKILSLVKSLFGLQTEVLVQRKKRLKKNYVYLIRVPFQQENNDILYRLGMVDELGRLRDMAPRGLLRRECCRRAYLRGVFLGGGSVNRPEGNYHLEIITDNRLFAETISSLMNKCNLAAKSSLRKNRNVVYLKESEHIVRFLNIIGAHSALLNFENARIYKDVRNNINRLVNCETANLNKTVNAAVRQIENINLINNTLGLEKIPESLRETAELRLKYPGACLAELGKLMRSPLGKSGVNHRLRKIEEIAEKIRGNKT
ncbi:MAG: DNA-binding protein WhiA [Desulfotomaculaceae bacterium]|nr:DNA-binding protein WhiA [Desulfotomaculaceae bacterium]MDD4766362.1 DNA-binding protein WhiA [Desulfotomaculaceae bacterium]